MEMQWKMHGNEAEGSGPNQPPYEGLHLVNLGLSIHVYKVV